MARSTWMPNEFQSFSWTPKALPRSPRIHMDARESRIYTGNKSSQRLVSRLKPLSNRASLELFVLTVWNGLNLFRKNKYLEGWCVHKVLGYRYYKKLQKCNFYGDQSDNGNNLKPNAQLYVRWSKLLHICCCLLES